MKRRLVGGGIGAVIALPWLALQLFGFVDAADPHALSGGALPRLLLANLALLCLFVAVASDFRSTSVRRWRAALIGIGVALSFLVRSWSTSLSPRAEVAVSLTGSRCSCRVWSSW